MAAVIKGKNARKPWTVRDWHDGRERERSFMTKREADDFTTKSEPDSRAQIFIYPKLGDVAFRDYASAWLSQHTGTVNTIKAFKGSPENHVNPAIGDTSLRKITREQVRTLLLEAMPAKPVGRPLPTAARS